MFKRKKDKTIIPKFYLEKPEYPMFMEPGIIFDNYFISKNGKIFFTFHLPIFA